MKKNANKIKNIVVILIMILLVVGFYFAISSRDNKKTASKEKVKTENGETLLKKDLEKEYPPTPTAVVSYYSDLVLTYYDDDCTDSMREKLVEQSRLLYDEELLEKNPEKDQMVSLEADVAEYKEKKKQIINYTVCKPEEVKYGDLDGDEVALMATSYRIRAGKNLGNIKEEYFLRKDEEGRWKIVGWQAKSSATTLSE